MTFRICISVEKSNDHYLYIFRNNNEFMRHFIPNIQKLKTAKTQELSVYEIYQDGLEHILTKWVDSDSSMLPAFSLPMPSIYETTERTVYKWDNPEINEFLLDDYKKRLGNKLPSQVLPFTFKRNIAEELSLKDLFVITIPDLSWLIHKQIHAKMTFQLPLDKTGNVIKKNIINKLKLSDFMLNYDSIIRGCVNPKQLLTKRETLTKKREMLEKQIQNIKKEIEDVDKNTPGKPRKRRREEEEEEGSGTDSTNPCYHEGDDDDDSDSDDDINIEELPPPNKRKKQST